MFTTLLKTQITPPDYSEPFYVQNVSSSSSVWLEFKTYPSDWTVNMEKSSDGLNWTSMGQITSTSQSLEIPKNSKMYFRGINQTLGTVLEDNPNNRKFTNIKTNSSTAKLGGNILSLLYGSNFTGSERSIPNNNVGCFNQLFNGGRWIDTSNLLIPIDSIPAWTFFSTFSECQWMVSAPSFEYTAVGDYAFRSCFLGCFALTKVPSMNVASVSKYAYQDCFAGCKGITNCPEFASSSLSEGCYKGMYSRCTALTKVPTINVSSVPARAFEQTFYNCTGLTQGPDINTEFAGDYAFNGLFSNCTSLSRTGTMNISYIGNDSLGGMFQQCTSLSQITLLTITPGSQTNITSNVAASGTFKKNSQSTWQRGVNGIPTSWSVVNVEHTVVLPEVVIPTPSVDYSTPFYLQNLSDAAGSVYVKSGSVKSDNYDGNPLEYSNDRITWSSLDLHRNLNVPFSLDPGQKIYFRTKSKCFTSGEGSSYAPYFSSDINFGVGGNLFSMIYGSDFTGNERTYDSSNYKTAKGFFEDTNAWNYLISSQKFVVPAVLDYNQYGLCQNMFSSCKNMTIGPEVLPASPVGSRGYMSMFSNSGITTSPVLPATEVGDAAYNNMFNNTKVTTVTLPSRSSGQSFSGCSTLTTVYAYFIDTPKTKNWLSSSTYGTLHISKYNMTPDSQLAPSSWTIIRDLN